MEDKKQSVNNSIQTWIGDQNKKVNFTQIVFDDTTFEINLENELKIEEADIVNSMLKHSETYGWWATFNSTVKRRLREKQRRAKEIEFQMNHSSSQFPKPSTWNELQKISLEIVSLEDMAEYIENVLKSYEHKRDMLKEINRAQCSESHVDPLH